MPLPEGFLGELGDIPLITEGAQLRQKSRDNFWYSPVLRRKLANVVADAIVRPRSEAEVLFVARTCWRHDVPLTPRGGGTANYGQCMPLEGGVVLDLCGLDQPIWMRTGAFRAQAGARLGAIERWLASSAQELRSFPSTRDTATLGGFIGGGSGGVGSLTWGMLRERGNILGARVVTVEAEPRAIEVRGAELHAIAHAYGTTGILTELELPTAPAQEWIEAVVEFADFGQGFRFGQDFAQEPALVKKLCSLIAAPIAQSYLKPLRGVVRDGHACCIAMIAAPSWDGFAELVAVAGGRIVLKRDHAEALAQRATPLFALCWNHTTMWALRADPALTYLQTSFPPGRALEAIDALTRRLGDEIMMHVEFFRSGPGWVCAGIPLVRYTSEERLEELMAIFESLGCRQFNPHVWTVEEGGMKQIDHRQVEFKRRVDPKGLLNPGKLLGWSNPDWNPTAGAPATPRQGPRQ